MRDMVSQIGEIEHIVCHLATFTRSIFPGGSLSNWKHIAVQPDRSTWEAPDQGGGYAYGQLSHALGILYWLTDLRAAETLHAIAASDKAQGAEQIIKQNQKAVSE
ncbi:hypothetical protein [Primorskyibacter marinus]|uniref:hypothetical protein n=1 Tax=Primorskyibacter marinus TaxID=1977320 RepID=UPI001300981A|nr:hypothetical protein [Primorskyibacter marinus]